MGGGRGERRVRPRRQAGVHNAVAAVVKGRERRWGVRWSMGSKGSNCAKGVSSIQWAAAWEGIGFGPGGWGGFFMVREIWFGSGDW
jgi:type II secretory pathway component GspD/PulD (secretin)